MTMSDLSDRWSNRCCCCCFFITRIHWIILNPTNDIYCDVSCETPRWSLPTSLLDIPLNSYFATTSLSGCLHNCNGNAITITAACHKICWLMHFSINNLRAPRAHTLRIFFVCLYPRYFHFFSASTYMICMHFIPQSPNTWKLSRQWHDQLSPYQK